MQLKYKYFLWSLTLVIGLLMVGGISVWNIISFRTATSRVAGEYDAMDRARTAIVQIAWLRDVLRGNTAVTYRDAKYFQPIQTQVTETVRELRLAARSDDGDAAAELDRVRAAEMHLQIAVAQNATSTAASDTIADELEQVRLALTDVANLVPNAVRHHVSAASDRLLTRLAWSIFWLIVVLVISLLIHIVQYRALVRPLLWLREGIRKSAAGEYRDPVLAKGSREFKDVAFYFNGLARDLADLYRGLEEKVIARSRELVRSERLASVGFLAAGVAHEINNPLSVISGYAELAAKSLRQLLCGEDKAVDGKHAEDEAEAISSALDTQRIIQEEAFRCKEITSRLLSLARGGGDGRELLCLDEVARQVTVLTRGLRNYRDRRITLMFHDAEPLEVMANPTEMKQVLLNLIVNALEAVTPDAGEVRISGTRFGIWVEVSVEDNGKGMSAGTLENVFEPFFTAKRGSGEPGTGLGLSITHAIVESHGGQIRAESRGKGLGSRFTVRLPAHVHESSQRQTIAVNGTFTHSRS